MAVTKIKPIKGTVKKAIEYIIDPAKTDDKILVSSYGCTANEFAATEFEWTRRLAEQSGAQLPKVLARHIIQSFDIGEVSPEHAHEIGKHFADEWLQGKYEYVIATHVDRDHCHNHIIFNDINFVDYHGYRSNRTTYRKLRKLSDEICKEHGLSVVPPSQSKGKEYTEYAAAKQGTSWKQKLKQTIDKCIIVANDWEEFLRLMEEAGYEVKQGKFISFRAEGQERFTRAKTIGENYTEDRLKERISGRNPRKRVHQTQKEKGISLIIDLQNSIKAQESKGYEHWAKMYNLKMMSETLNYLVEHDLHTIESIDQELNALQVRLVENGKKLKEVETQISQTQLMIKHFTNYRKTKPVYDAYVKAKDKAAFRGTHESELIIFEAAEKELKSGKMPVTTVSIEHLQRDLFTLEAERKELYEERNSIKSKAENHKAIKANVIAINNELSSDRDVNLAK